MGQNPQIRGGKPVTSSSRVILKLCAAALSVWLLWLAVRPVPVLPTPPPSQWPEHLQGFFSSAAYQATGIQRYNMNNFLPHIMREDVCTLVIAGATWDGHFKSFIGTTWDRHFQHFISDNSENSRALSVLKKLHEMNAANTTPDGARGKIVYEVGWYSYHGQPPSNDASQAVDERGASALPSPWWPAYTSGSYDMKLFRGGRELSEGDELHSVFRDTDVAIEYVVNKCKR